jgi:tetratricopeptide (TPR) repeat protein
MALNNLANRLSEVGQREAALAPAQEATDLYRQLAAKAPDAWRPDLAMALNNLANSLSEVGQREAALATAQEAVAIRRELAAKAPDAYRPALAGSLAVLANRLEENGDLERALESNREAIELYRPYFRALPQAFVHWILPMCRQYIERCEKLGREADAEILAPIAETLHGMREGSAREEQIT